MSHDQTTTTAASIHNDNCRSFLGTASYWVDQKQWDKAIDNLKAAIRAANRAGNLRTAGMAFVAIRRRLDAKHALVAATSTPNTRPAPFDAKADMA